MLGNAAYKRSSYRLAHPVPDPHLIRLHLWFHVTPSKRIVKSLWLASKEKRRELFVSHGCVRDITFPIFSRSKLDFELANFSSFAGTWTYSLCEQWTFGGETEAGRCEKVDRIEVSPFEIVGGCRKIAFLSRTIRSCLGFHSWSQDSNWNSWVVFVRLE